MTPFLIGQLMAMIPWGIFSPWLLIVQVLGLLVMLASMDS